MKIPAGIEAEFDEKMMLKRKLPGLLPVEKCYVDGAGQYWYNISGKQSLDTYCRFKSIDVEFVEQLIISICSEIAILEQNLLDQNTILLEPELIFIANNNKEIIFAVYPGNKETVNDAFRELMEYLLTKIDHKEMEAVHAAYGIYEKTLNASYSLSDIRDEILYERSASMQEVPPKTEKPKERRQSLPVEKKEQRIKEKEKKEYFKAFRIPMGTFTDLNKIYQEIQQKFVTWKDQLLNFHKKERIEKEQTPLVAYPEDELYEEKPQIHPTVCLRQNVMHPEGLLLYEGADSFSDICLDRDVSRIGKDAGSDIIINKETISRFHAKIYKEKDEYYIEDLNSTNGTYVNDEILSYKEPKKLNSNDQVRFADVKYRFL